MNNVLFCEYILLISMTLVVK